MKTLILQTWEGNRQSAPSLSSIIYLDDGPFVINQDKKYLLFVQIKANLTYFSEFN